MTWLSKQDLNKIGFARLGNNVLISEKASLYNCKNIAIGNNTRIDDFCVLSAGEGGIEIGSFIHISVYASLIGAGKITICDFSGISSRVSVYSSNDDYSGAFLTNPTIPDEFTNVTHQPVTICRHTIIGSGCIVLPGVTIGEGVAVGSLSLVTKNCTPFGIYAGVPAKRIKDRKRDLLKKETELMFKLSITQQQS